MENENRVSNNVNKTNYRVKNTGAILIAFFAIFCDLVSLIPFVGDFVGPIFWVIVGIYLYTAKVKLLDAKRLAVMGADMVIKMIPVLQELPVELLIGWIAIVMMTRIEDRAGISMNPTKIGTTAPRIQRIPVNAQEGTRLPNPVKRNGDLRVQNLNNDIRAKNTTRNTGN